MTPFPVKEAVLCAFVAYLALCKNNLSAGLVKSYLAAIHHAQISLGLRDPKITNMPKLEYVIKGLCRKAMGREVHPCLSITHTILHNLKNVWDQLLSREDVMLWGAACLFIGFQCTGEMVVPSDAGYDPQVHLSFQGVKVDNRQKPKWLEVHLRESKSDPVRHRVTVSAGATGKWLCPAVTSVLVYMAQRGNKLGPLFMFRDGHHSRPMRNSQLRNSTWPHLLQQCKHIDCDSLRMHYHPLT